MAEGIRYQSLHGEALRPHLDALAALRITVFREWPYLYEGTLDYERDYLQAYIATPRSLVVLAYDGDALVGATTALPLAEAPEALREPFRNDPEALATTLYFGESVVLQSHRGRGIGVRFFALREDHARALGLSRCTFCAVERPAAHPARPAGHVGNEAFWSHRGYIKQAALVSHFPWLDVGDSAPTVKPMIYWSRSL